MFVIEKTDLETYKVYILHYPIGVSKALEPEVTNAIIHDHYTYIDIEMFDKTFTVYESPIEQNIYSSYKIEIDYNYWGNVSDPNQAQKASQKYDSETDLAKEIARVFWDYKRSLQNGN